MPQTSIVDPHEGQSIFAKDNLLYALGMSENGEIT
jgi:hypothetical protein